MKVSEMIKHLQKCEQDADVEFAYASDATTTGTEIVSIVQIMYFGDEENGTSHTVQIQGV